MIVGIQGVVKRFGAVTAVDAVDLTVADGELLVVVWRGEVAVRTPQGFERAHQRSGASSATALWESVLVVSATSETEWGWAPAKGEGDTRSSAALAHHCVERLRAAYAECTRPR